MVAALRAHVAAARVAEMACWRLGVLCTPAGSRRAAAEAGAIEAVVEAMGTRTHPQVANVAVDSCRALGNM